MNSETWVGQIDLEADKQEKVAEWIVGYIHTVRIQISLQVYFCTNLYSKINQNHFSIPLIGYSSNLTTKSLTLILSSNSRICEKKEKDIKGSNHFHVH